MISRRRFHMGFGAALITAGASAGLKAACAAGSDPRLIDEVSARPAAQRAVALKDRHSFKADMDEEARRIMFPQNARLAS